MEMRQGYMIINLLNTLLVLLIMSCQSEICNCEIEQAQLIKLEELDSIIKEDNIIKREEKAWSKYKEPSLLKANTDNYRFDIDNLFGNRKIYRIENSDEGYKLFIKEYDTTGEPDFRDTILRDEVHFIAEKKWIEMASYLDQNCFWTMPYNIERGGFDGIVWNLEGYRSNSNNCTKKSFHSVRRWSPIDTVFILMCEKLRDLANEE